MGVEPAPLAFRQTMQEAPVREMEWAPPKEAAPVFVTEETPPEEYGPWQWAAAFGRATGRFGADAFVLQENGRLRCPAGASLWLSEVRQENALYIWTKVGWLSLAVVLDLFSRMLARLVHGDHCRCDPGGTGLTHGHSSSLSRGGVDFLTPIVGAPIPVKVIWSWYSRMAWERA